MIARVLPVAILASLALGAFAAAAQADGDIVATPAAITALDDTALAKAYPEKRNGLVFEEGHFSPGGAFFAFSVSQIESGDPEQVWLYSLHTRKLVPVTEAPKKDTIGFTISGFTFGRDDTLYVAGERIDWRNQGNNQMLQITATMTRSTEMKAFPKDIAAALAAQAAGDDDDSIIWRGDPYDITARNLGHGALTLSAKNRKTGQIRKITDGSWELQHVLFDGHARLRYADATGIVTLDLCTGSSRRLVVARARPPGRLLDQTRDGLIAYMMYGPCEPDKYGAVRGGDPQSICFIKGP